VGELSHGTVDAMAETLEWHGSLDAALDAARQARKIALVDYVKPG
jgi:hypothetical protein